MAVELIPKVPSIPVHAVKAGKLGEHFEALSDLQKNWAQEQNFSAKLGETLLLPDEEGALDVVLFGIGNDRERARSRLVFGTLAKSLPAGNYHLVCDSDEAELASLAWLLSSYKFDRFKSNSVSFPKLVRLENIDYEEINSIAQASHLAMDWINRPANDLNPVSFEDDIRAMGMEKNVEVQSIVGNQLSLKNFPLIAAVGQASVHQPRLVEFRDGPSNAPKVTLVGKGVCFDTGGLNLKPGSSMGTMKKDMGGAANVLALAQMILDAKLHINLRVLVPIVENSVSSNAFRPGDILTARNGLTVEINNTDAEGRLILADALAYGAEESPDLMISMATLTGAARVAVGPDLSPFFSTDEDMASSLMAHGTKVEDPLWQLPFWPGYEDMVESENADLDNAPAGGMAGAITAALFLKRFAGRSHYAHFDIYGWSPKELPGRPKGGAVQGTRAIFSFLKEKYGNS